MKELVVVAVTIGLGAALAYAIGGQSRLLWGTPLLWLLVAQSFIIQFIAYIPAVIFNTEKFYDLTGSLTFLSAAAVATLTNSRPDLQQYLAAGMITVWAGRLGSFLFLRVLKAGQDSRFEKIKKSKLRFLMVWTLQGLWTVVPASPLLVILTRKAARSTLGDIELAGLVIWFVGLTLEAVADHQKSVFNSEPHNKGRFINRGLWAWSRHPNYVGEVLIWVGAVIFAFPTLQGAQCMTLISPIFEYFLLWKVSGVPMLERKSDKKWGTE
jgi:steroid 5-alpha reductase family enzyme